MQSKTPLALSARQLLTVDGWRHNATLVVENGHITAIEDGVQGHVHDCLLAGMPNLHSHAFQRAMAGLTERRGQNPHDSFWTWREQMYRFLHALTPEDNHAIARWLYIEMLKAGYTRVGEFHYLHHQPDGTPHAEPAAMAQSILAAAADTGIGLTLLPVHYATSDFGGTPPTEGQRRFIHSTDAFLKLVESLRAPCREQGHILGIAPHSLRAVTQEMLHDVLAALPSLGMADCPKHMHVAEQVKEVEASVLWSGRRPAEWMLDNVPLDETWCFIHATHLTHNETVELAKTGVVAGLCPTTEGNLGDGIFPAQHFLQEGGQFGIGTDSHIAINPADELRMLEYGQRLAHQSRAVLSSEISCGKTLWQRAVKGGNRALGVAHHGLSVGAPADCISLDCSSPLFAGKTADTLLDTAIFGLPQLPVAHVFIAGKPVVENGHHPAEEEAAQGFRKVLERVLA
jgi:formimidoylglutamate deiminase